MLLRVDAALQHAAVLNRLTKELDSTNAKVRQCLRALVVVCVRACVSCNDSFAARETSRRGARASPAAGGERSRACQARRDRRQGRSATRRGALALASARRPVEEDVCARRTTSTKSCVVVVGRRSRSRASRRLERRLRRVSGAAQVRHRHSVRSRVPVRPVRRRRQRTLSHLSRRCREHTQSVSVKRSEWAHSSIICVFLPKQTNGLEQSARLLRFRFDVASYGVEVRIWRRGEFNKHAGD